MKSHFTLKFGSMSDTGQVRSHNEDSITFNSDLGLAILADGMGGYNAGEIASAMASSIARRVIENQFQSVDTDAITYPDQFVRQLLAASATAANTAIFEAASNESEFSGMGTTLVIMLFYEDAVAVAHIGDSRAYRFRDQRLTQITRDHSLLQEQLDAGLINAEQAQFSQHKNLITRAVGVETTLETDINVFSVVPGDLYLLCSDGLSDMLTDQKIVDTLEAYIGDPSEAASKLVERANEEGGRDNISVILVHTRKA